MTSAMVFTMVLCFALTISVAVSIGLAALVGIQVSNVNMLVAVKEMFSSINKFPLAAIPFFILAGNLMETGGISRRLVEFAKIMQVSTQVIGRPPCTPPTMLLANSTRRREMPPVSIRLPARMKNGIAASGNLLIEENISLTATSMLRLLTWMPTKAARPIETATEMVSAKHITIVTSIAAVTVRSPVRGASGRASCRRSRSR